MDASAQVSGGRVRGGVEEGGKRDSDARESGSTAGGAMRKGGEGVRCLTSLSGGRVPAVYGTGMGPQQRRAQVVL